MGVWFRSYLNSLVVFSTFFKSEFCNKEFMIWATVSSWSYFFWLYRASPSLASHHIHLWLLRLHIRWPKYWSFSFSISLSNEYSGLISFRIDWLDLLAVQGTLKSLLQHYNSKASILRCSAFFLFQLLHPYMTTGKIITLTRQTYVSKKCLCFLLCVLDWS